MRTLLLLYQFFLVCEIVNGVVSHDLGKELNLAHLTLALPRARTEWEPEQFPGLIYRLGGLSAVCLIFSSGKCVITGNNSLDDAQEEGAEGADAHGALDAPLRYGRLHVAPGRDGRVTARHPGRARGQGRHVTPSACFHGALCRLHFGLGRHLRGQERGARLSRSI